MSHAFGAAFDNPDLIVCCVVGDGEAETGPLVASWHSNKLLNPVIDGAVLAILGLNGDKIANPTVLGRIPDDELRGLFFGYGYAPRFLTGSEPAEMHERMAATLDDVIGEIRALQRRAREDGDATRPRWPMIVLSMPKGWAARRRSTGWPSKAPFDRTRCLRHSPGWPTGRTICGRSMRRCGLTGPRSCSTTPGRCGPTSPSPHRPEGGAWAPFLRETAP